MSFMDTPASVQRDLAGRAKAARLRLGWSRAELAHRSGVASATIREFERSGRIGLSRLLAIAASLRVLEPFNGLFPAPAARCLDELEAREAGPSRRRGRTLTAAARPEA